MVEIWHNTKILYVHKNIQEKNVDKCTKRKVLVSAIGMRAVVATRCCGCLRELDLQVTTSIWWSTGCSMSSSRWSDSWGRRCSRERPRAWARGRGGAQRRTPRAPKPPSWSLSRTPLPAGNPRSDLREQRNLMASQI